MDPIKVISLLGSIQEPLEEERFETLLSAPGVILERILSKGQITPEGTWYDQAHAEWVLLLSGKAHLRIEGQQPLLTLMPGDAVLLPAHCRHRVEWTDPDKVSVWLALHVAGENS